MESNWLSDGRFTPPLATAPTAGKGLEEPEYNKEDQCNQWNRHFKLVFVCGVFRHRKPPNRKRILPLSGFESEVCGWIATAAWTPSARRRFLAGPILRSARSDGVVHWDLEWEQLEHERSPMPTIGLSTQG